MAARRPNTHPRQPDVSTPLRRADPLPAVITTARDPMPLVEERDRKHLAAFKRARRSFDSSLSEERSEIIAFRRRYAVTDTPEEFLIELRGVSFEVFVHELEQLRTRVALWMRRVADDMRPHMQHDDYAVTLRLLNYVDEDDLFDTDQADSVPKDFNLLLSQIDEQFSDLIQEFPEDARVLKNYRRRLRDIPYLHGIEGRVYADTRRSPRAQEPEREQEYETRYSPARVGTPDAAKRTRHSYR